MRARILVTRPKPGASATARRLKEAGFEPVLLPLTEIRQLPLPTGQRLERPDAMVVSSANAIRLAPPELLAAQAGRPCLAVGAETAKAAVEAGFNAVTSADGDADALTRIVLKLTPPGARILYLTGRVRRAALEERLATAGRTVETVEIYDTLPIAYSANGLDRLLAGRTDAVLLHSARAAELLARLPGAGRRFESAIFLGLSQRIGTALPPALRKRFRSAGTPDEAALFRLLGEAFPPTP